MKPADPAQSAPSAETNYKDLCRDWCKRWGVQDEDAPASLIALMEFCVEAYAALRTAQQSEKMRILEEGLKRIAVEYGCWTEEGLSEIAKEYLKKAETVAAQTPQQAANAGTQGGEKEER